MKHHSHRALTALAAIGLSISALAACGSDSKDSGSLSAAACDTAVAYGAAFSQAPHEPDEFAGYAQKTLAPIGADLVENFTGKNAAAAKTINTAIESIVADGDPSVLESPDVTAAQTTIGSAVHSKCDLQAVDIEAVEYAFVDAPTSLKSGRVSFALQNKGVEDHEMVLFKRADGVTDSIDDLLALPEDELMSKVAFTGVTFGAPGTTNYVAVDLEPGTYFLLCFLPQGGGEDGPPHFMAGMKHTLEVA
jgi:hypothetical protein